MKRPLIIAANHKMHFDREAFEAYAEALSQLLEPWTARLRTLVVVIPSFPHLDRGRTLLPEMVALGGQDCHWAEEGAYTGGVSAAQLRSYGCSYVIIGHSERRRDYAEAEPLLLKKVTAALQAGLTPIYCCGETLEQREAGEEKAVVTTQIEGVFAELSRPQARSMIVAYEPVWAIGTGKTATPEQAQQMHAHIRRTLAALHGEDIAQKISILYGGSIKPHNAAGLFQQPDIDGGLIGGASLNPADLLAIIEAAHETL